MIRVMLLGLFTCLLVACGEPAMFTSTEKHQFSDALVLDGQISADAKQVMLLIEGPNLAVWRTHDKQIVMTLNEEQLPAKVRAISLSERAKLLIVAGDNSVQLWHSLSGKLLGTIDLYAVDELARVSALTTRKDGSEIAVGFTDGSVALFDYENKKMKQFMPHSSNIMAIEFYQNKIITGSHDGSVKAWDAHTGTTQYQRQYTSRLSSLALSADKQQLFVADGLKTQQVLLAENGEVASELTYISRFKWFRQALFIPNSNYLVTSTPKSELNVWETSLGKEQVSWQIDSHSMGTTLLDMVIINNELITLSSEGVIEVWPLMSILTQL
ncbi:hypothetical protein PSECIP111951_00182 [Pseudoalteromonas holothuriae]|uniref:Anaphase-promoting complex subunit 4-like WD40 domain-containing protein n=1 Tax=Pseudoalteromonas holothuriae TaxID=2963714 RepID=A0A9W4W1L3_9GAMM|nr:MULTISPECIES: WD40 repeat domain-containing protein [unclassified Pseudoalteromonas]CAH9050389.1 hypothetical protein PSECIP111951_00182 [Pseudoalteromonas sp. CIP111951]CAH9052297.1 hypothetical protein PSECIP111854_00938 [Pseudoalteromonas sp. CIP111854]